MILPIKISIEKSSLSISRGSSAVSAILKTVDEMKETKAISVEMTFSGSDFKSAELSLVRTIGSFQGESIIGRIDSGIPEETKTFFWKPRFQNFDSLLVTSSLMSLTDFRKYLNSLETRISNSPESFLASPFTMLDGVGIDYSLRLTGHKHYFGELHDETKVSFSLQN